MQLQVFDPSYRQALALAPSDFVTDLAEANHGVLSAIETVASLEPGSVTAHLYKLNIHRPGDFFKAHLDTPRTGNIFGSLVVCLPNAFSGGELVIRHLGQSATYSWGDQQADSSPAFEWAFFYSDCEHEILPVTAGLRVTLAFNLECTPQDAAPPKTMDPITLPFTRALHAALDCCAFMPEGCELGFALQHLYPHTSKGFSISMLKGADAVILSAAKRLNLEVAIEPVWKTGDFDSDCHIEFSEYCECEYCSEKPGFVKRAWAAGTGDPRMAIGGPMEIQMGQPCLCSWSWLRKHVIHHAHCY